MQDSIRRILWLALLSSTSALGQSGPPGSDAGESTEGTLEVVVVTGTRITTTAAESTSTVQVITDTDIARLGVTNVADLLSSLTAGTNGSSDITAQASFAPGATSVGLRNLDAQSTLVLLNGRRVAPNGLADYNLVFTNVDAFPLDAIDHVEVLLTGGSAVYGSDAVAGVINIITRHDFTGLELRADRQQSMLGDKFETSTAALTAGVGNKATDGYNVMLNVDYFDRASVMWTNYLGEVNPRMTSVSPVYAAPSTYSPYGNFIDTATGNSLPGRGCPSADIQGGLCLYNRYERIQAVPQARRLHNYLDAEADLHPGLTAFFEGTYAQDNTAYVNPFPYYGAAGSQFLLRNGTNFYFMELPPQSPLNPFGTLGDNAEFRYRFADDPNQQTAQNSQYRALAGLRGALGSSNWESAIGVMGSREVSMQNGPSASAFTRYIGCYLLTCATIDPLGPGNATVSTDPNFFNQPGGYRIGGPNSAAVLNALFPEFGFTGKYTQAFWDGKLSGRAFALPAGDAQYAAGAELRHEDYSINPTANLVSGDIIGVGVSSVDSARTFGAAFAELSVPLARRLLADAAVRLDKFPGFNTHFSPKVGFNWKIVEGLHLRGSWEEGFRAPNLVETANAVKVGYAGLADPARCPAAEALINALYAEYGTLPPGSAKGAGVLARIDDVYNNECNNSLFTQTNGNPNLKPETSQSYALGLVFELARSCEATLDYWNIRRDNTIGELGASQIVDFALAGQPLPAGTSVTRNPFNPKSDPSFSGDDTQLGGINDFTTFGVPTLGQLRATTTQFANLYSQKTAGFDLALRALSPIGNAWALDTQLNATYLLDYHDASVTNFYENLAGQYGFPRLIANITLGLVHAAWDTGFRINYIEGYALQDGTVDTAWTPAGCAAQELTPQQCHVGSNTTVNYFLLVQPTARLSVTFNVINIAASKAPPDQKAFGGTAGFVPPPSALQDAQGRLLKLGFSYKVF